MPQLFKNTLQGPNLTLKSFEASHLDGLQVAANHENIWTYVKAPTVALADHLPSYFDQLTMGHLAQDPFAYTIFQNGKIVGSTRYYEISPADQRLCIGYTWYSPEFWGSKINPEAKLLLLTQVFEDLKWNRVGFHVDSRNQRSLSAMDYLGAHREGVLRRHRIVQGDYVRDTVMMSIIREDWPRIKENLAQRIYA